MRFILRRTLNFYYYGACIPYAIATALNTGTILYSLKDLYAVVIIIFLLPKIIINSPYNKSKFLLLYTLIVVLLSSINFIFDSSFNLIGYLFGLREMVISPFLFLTIGYFTKKYHSDTEKLLYQSLFFVCFLTISYEIVFGLGFSANRLRSFWDGEHETGNIGALLFLITLVRYGLPSFSFTKFTFNKIPIHVIFAYFFSILLLIESGSRSAFTGIFVTFLFNSLVANIDIIKLRLKTIIVPALFTTLFGVMVTIYYWNSLFTRSLDHGLYLRFNQWLPAFEIISNNWLSGIGIHKIAAIEGFYSSYYALSSSKSTSTMDSSIIKYLLIIGIPATLILVSLIINYSFKSIKLPSSLKLNYCGMFMIYVLTIGSFTGKLGAFPTNFYLWSSLGTIIFMKRKVKGL